MNNEPVAWMQTWENQDGELKRTVNIEQIGKQDIPLYTHPVKELTLTGEEMISIYEKDWSGIKCGLGRAVEQAILIKASK